jgi:hypothetical protein
MAEQTVYCEECVEDIPPNEVYWDEGRLYCRRCGGELEPPDRDVFEDILDHRAGMTFRDDEPSDDDDEEEDEADDAEEEGGVEDDATPTAEEEEKG